MGIGKLFQSIFGGNDDSGQAELELYVNARVVDALGAKGVITHIDPKAEHGLGIVRVRYDDGRTGSFSLSSSGLTIISD